MIFYDGPIVDVYFVENLLSRLYTWQCEQPLVLGKGSVTSSMGDIMLVIIRDWQEVDHFFLLYLKAYCSQQALLRGILSY